MPLKHSNNNWNIIILCISNILRIIDIKLCAHPSILFSLGIKKTSFVPVVWYLWAMNWKSIDHMFESVVEKFVSFANAFSQSIRNFVSKNTKQPWTHWLIFPFHVKKELGNKSSLTFRIKQNFVKFTACNEGRPFSYNDKDTTKNSKTVKSWLSLLFTNL